MYHSFSAGLPFVLFGVCYHVNSKIQILWGCLIGGTPIWNYCTCQTTSRRGCIRMGFYHIEQNLVKNNSVFQENENMVGVAATGLFHTELIVVLTCFDS